MCDKCNELRQAFQDTVSIIEREALWKLYDAQRGLCNPDLARPKAKATKAKVKK